MEHKTSAAADKLRSIVKSKMSRKNAKQISPIIDQIIRAVDMYGAEKCIKYYEDEDPNKFANPVQAEINRKAIIELIRHYETLK